LTPSSSATIPSVPLGKCASQNTEQDSVKRRYLDEWTQAVNAHGGFGRWRSAVAGSPGEIQDILMQQDQGVRPGG